VPKVRRKAGIADTTFDDRRKTWPGTGEHVHADRPIFLDIS
jgi:hypothetical protein